MNTYLGLCVGLMAVFGLYGCAVDPERISADFIARMDASPPDERVPNWETTRALMLREAPRVGDEAPDFTLTTIDGSGTVELSGYEGKQPVVLIFGSWT